MKKETNLSTVIPILLTIVAVTNNLLVMFIVFCTKQLRKNINFYIVNMAVSDMITSLVICMRFIVSYLYEAHGILVLNDVICKLFSYFKCVALTVSLLTLLVISSDRYRAVSSPLNVTNVPQPCFVSLVLLTWIIPGIIFVYKALKSQHVLGRDLCETVPVAAGLTITEIIALSFIVVLYVCLIVINIQILRKLKKSTASLSGLSDTERRKRNKKFRSAVRMVLCSLFLYVLCTLLDLFSHVIFLVWQSFFPSDVPTFFKISAGFLVANSALGSVVYFIFLQDFREALKEMVYRWSCCDCRGRPVTAHQPNTIPFRQTRTSVHENNIVCEQNEDK